MEKGREDTWDRKWGTMSGRESGKDGRPEPRSTCHYPASIGATIQNRKLHIISCTPREGRMRAEGLMDEIRGGGEREEDRIKTKKDFRRWFKNR